MAKAPNKALLERTARGEKQNLRAELDQLDARLATLKLLYEQYFTGLIPLAPEKQHAEVRTLINKLVNAPFKNSAINFRLKTLTGKYNSFNSYWLRVLKEREEGRYHKDVFKADMRLRNQAEDERAETTTGAAEKGITALFNAYKTALEKSSGRKQDLDFKSFQHSLLQRARDFKEQHGVSKLKFSVVVKDGKVVVQAKVKE